MRLPPKRTVPATFTPAQCIAFGKAFGTLNGSARREATLGHRLSARSDAALCRELLAAFTVPAPPPHREGAH